MLLSRSNRGVRSAAAPCLAFVDMSIAFTSVAHPFLVLCMQASRFSGWVIAAVAALYMGATVYGVGGP